MTSTAGLTRAGPLPIVISEDAPRLSRQQPLPQAHDGRGIVEERPASAYPGLDRNQLSVSNIPLHGGAVTVYGRNVPPGLSVHVQGRDVPVSDAE